MYVNDPGEPGGAGRAYPLDQLLDAWADSGRYFMATDDAPPDLAAYPAFEAGFDSAAGTYLAKGFWADLATRVAGALAAAAVDALFDRVPPRSRSRRSVLKAAIRETGRGSSSSAWNCRPRC